MQGFDIDIDLEISSFPDEKVYKKFVKSCKTIIRQSIEYKDWVKYIKFSLGYDYCSMTKESAHEVTLDLHHHPFSLENIVKLVIDRLLTERGKVTSFDVSKYVMQLHYDNNIGYVLLVKTLHEKFHNGFLDIPIELVHGNWKYLVENFSLTEEIKEVVSRYSMITIESVKKKYGNIYTWSKDNYVLTEV